MHRSKRRKSQYCTSILILFGDSSSLSPHLDLEEKAHTPSVNSTSTPAIRNSNEKQSQEGRRGRKVRQEQARCTEKASNSLGLGSKCHKCRGIQALCVVFKSVNRLTLSSSEQKGNLPEDGELQKCLWHCLPRMDVYLH